MAHDVAALAARLDAGGPGSWLSPGEVAALLNVGRTTVHRMIKAGDIHTESKTGVGTWRVCDPKDVRRIRAAMGRLSSDDET